MMLPYFVILLCLGTVVGKDATTASSTSSTTLSSITSSSTATLITSTSVAPTTAATCEDDPEADCAKLKSLCSDPRYYDLLEKHCQKTCNRCGVTDEPCFDASTECSFWNVNGFCHSTFYPEEMKKTYCSKTCHLC